MLLRKVVGFLLADYVREYVRGECGYSAFGKGFYENHLLVVAQFGLRLARETGADLEIVELAAYLHDFSVVLDMKTLPDHKKKGVEIAENLLRHFNYPADKLEKVKLCILNHSSPASGESASLEEVCLANADIMSRIAKPDYWLNFYYSVLKVGDGKSRYLDRINLEWPLLIESARDIIKEQYIQASKRIES